LSPAADDSNEVHARSHYPYPVFPGCKKGEFFYNKAMRIRWDEAKRQQVLQRRHIDFAQLTELFCWPRSRRRPLSAAQSHPTTCLLAYHGIAISNEDFCQVF